MLVAGSAAQQVQVEHLAVRGVQDDIRGPKPVESGGTNCGCQVDG